MKKTLCFSIIGMALAMPARSAERIVNPPPTTITKCVKLSGSASCTSSYSSYVNSREWTATCGGITVKGMSACSSTASTTFYAKHTSIAVSPTTSSNKYCKCKMISPALSTYWVNIAVCTTSSCLGMGSQTAAQCEQYCAFSCAMDMTTGSDLPSALFSSMTN